MRITEDETDVNGDQLPGGKVSRVHNEVLKHFAKGKK